MYDITTQELQIIITALAKTDPTDMYNLQLRQSLVKQFEDNKKKEEEAPKKK